MTNDTGSKIVSKEKHDAVIRIASKFCEDLIAADCSEEDAIEVMESMIIGLKTLIGARG